MPGTRLWHSIEDSLNKVFGIVWLFEHLDSVFFLDTVSRSKVRIGFVEFPSSMKKIRDSTFYGDQRYLWTIEERWLEVGWVLNEMYFSPGFWSLKAFVSTWDDDILTQCWVWWSIKTSLVGLVLSIYLSCFLEECLKLWSSLSDNPATRFSTLKPVSIGDVKSQHPP